MWDQWFVKQTERASGRQKFDAKLSERGMLALKDNDAPSRKQEAWRYTDLKALLYADPAATSATLTEDAVRSGLDELLESREEDDAFVRLVFVDGVLSEDLSQKEHGAADVFVGGSQSLARQEPELRSRAERLLRDLPEVDTFVPAAPRDALGCAKMAALNHALFEDCALILCPDADREPESEAEVRVEVVFVTTGASEACCSPRVLVDAGRSRRLHVVESHLSLNLAGGEADASLSNAVCRVLVGQGAQVRHQLLQQKSLDARMVESVTAEVDSKGRYDLLLVQSGARSARVNVAVALQGESSACEVNGVMIAAKDQQLDLHSLIHHSIPSCTSSQSQKHVVSDAAECVFKGMIRVDKQAQQTTSDQICRSLLVSKRAKVKAMPSLQIRADDVTCSHGAAVTKLDESQVFYMMSRGLDRHTAQKLLLVAFPQDLLGGLGDVAPRANQRMLDRLADIAESHEA